MADTRTANEWQQVADNATAEITQLQNNIARLRAQVNQQRVTGRINLGTVQEIQNLNRRVEELEVVRITAENEVEIAKDSPRGTRANPTTLSNTPPVTEENDPFEQQRRESEEILNNPPVTQEEIQQSIADADTQDQIAAAADVGNASPSTTPAVTADPNRQAITGINNARNTGNQQQFVPFPEAPDYRVRISLAPSATYLYKDPDLLSDDLLWPLRDTNGVIFPYTPQINLSYSASYAATDLPHSNYKIYNYGGSSVEAINITGDFTAQDVLEANYILAVIHFFRSVTKMFYGKDQDPIRGVPPPLVYLSGHGQYGFDNHPMVIQSFNLNYPTEVDYINAGPSYNANATFKSNNPPNAAINTPWARLFSSKLQPGGINAPPKFSIQNNSWSLITRVPTKLQIQITALPIVTRYDIANEFSLKQYATGKLLRGSKRPRGGGMW